MTTKTTPIIVLLAVLLLSACDPDGSKQLCYKLGYAQDHADSYAQEFNKERNTDAEVAAARLCR